MTRFLSRMTWEIRAVLFALQAVKVPLLRVARKVVNEHQSVFQLEALDATDGRQLLQGIAEVTFETDRILVGTPTQPVNRFDFHWMGCCVTGIKSM